MGMGLGSKIILSGTLLILAAIGTVVHISTDLFREESLTRVQETNKDVAEALSSQVFSIIKDSTARMSTMAQTIIQSQTPGQISTETASLLRTVLNGSDEMISFSIYRPTRTGYEEIFSMAKQQVLAEYDAKPDDFRLKPQREVLSVAYQAKDEITLTNSSPYFKKPVLTIAFFTKESDKTKERWFIRSEIRQEPLIELFSRKKYVTAYLVDHNGNLLVHSDANLVLHKYNLANYPIVQKIREGKLNNHQMEFEDESGGNWWLGAFKNTGVGKTAVVAQVDRGYALRAVFQAQNRSIYVTIIVIGIAFVFNFFFSQSLTRPLEELEEATQQIAEGNFNLKLNVNSGDEIGELAEQFLGMTKGLQERDKLRGAFDKFHSKEVSKKILSGEVKLGGERKIVTVFFSDIRGFTTMSETMSPDEVVNMLNEYISEMVKIVFKYKGVLDKYVGDAIMALWGAPEASPDDTLNAVRAAVEMRGALKALNEKRKTRGQKPIAIGMGINTGEVVAGNFGSNERMEYTVIGDNVNQASRLEGANKEVGGDLLISDSTWVLIRDRGFEAGPPIKLHVKGKNHDVIVHQVVGYRDPSGNLVSYLGYEEIEKIRKGETEMGKKDQHHEPVPAPVNESQIDMWYLVRDINSPMQEGPFNEKQLKAILGQPGFKMENAYAFKDGEDEMTPVLHIPGLVRRGVAELPPITVELPPDSLQSQAHPGEWYLYGGPTEFFGPYTVAEIKQALQTGAVTRTTYWWHIGYANWVYLFQIPGFDRRLTNSAEGLKATAIPLDRFKKSS